MCSKPYRIIVKIMCVALCLTVACQKMNREEALSSIRKIKYGEATFRRTQGKYGTLKELSAAGLLNSSITGGTNYGYRYTIRVKDDSYEAFAVPVEYSESAQKGTGMPSFYVNELGLIRGGVHEGKEGNAEDPPLADFNQ